MSSHARAVTESSANDDGRSLLLRIRYTPMRDVIRGCFTGRLHVAHLVKQADLPDPLPSLVAVVVRRTRLWRMERADVARELIAHFQDGLDSGASSLELAGSFGDSTRAAKLIRRAKKRSRPLVWRLFARTVKATFLVVGLAIALYAIMAVRFLIGRPTPTIDYRPHLNVHALAVPEAQRAWPRYREALLQLGLPAEGVIDTSNWNRRPRPGETGWVAFETYLMERQDALMKVRAAAAMPGFGFVADYGLTVEDQKLWPDSPLTSDVTDDFGTFGILLPYLSSMRNLAKTLQLDVERAAAAGDGDTVVANIQAMLGLVRHAREMPLLVNDLVALAIFHLTMNTIGDVLHTWPDCLTTQQMRDVAHLVAAWDDRDLNVRIDGERIGFDDLLQRIYTDGGQGDGRVTFAGIRKMMDFVSLSDRGVYGVGRAPIELLAAPVMCEIMLGRKEMRAEFERLLNIAEAEAAMPMWHRHSERFDEEINAIASSSVERIRKLPVWLMMPALGKPWQNSERVRAQRDAALVALALSLHHRQHGTWPSTLEQLVPTLLPAVPPDRFDGQPLKYAVVHGRPLVYSVGTDRDDDGGRHPRDAHGDLLRGATERWVPRDELKLPDGTPSAQVVDGDWQLWPLPTVPLRSARE